MRKELGLIIKRYGQIVPELSRIVGKNNEGTQMVTLPDIDMMIFTLNKEHTEDDDVVYKTEYGGKEDDGTFALSVFEDDTLVAIVVEKEIYTLDESINENVPLQRYLQKESEFVTDENMKGGEGL